LLHLCTQLIREIMKKARLLLAFVVPMIGQAQESYGKTANLALGYGWYIASLPVVYFNYEFDAAPNFTLALFVTLIHYRDSYKWGGKKYKYGSTVIPVGL